MNFDDLIRQEIGGLFSEELSRINKINEWYKIYEGRQEWRTNYNLDYKPTKKITNYIKKLIDKKAHFMFGKEPYFQLQSQENPDKAQEKENLLLWVLKENKWHSKLLKAKKDCSIAGCVALKLWAERDRGVKINFSPAQEFIVRYGIDDTDRLEKAVFFYALNDETEKARQRLKKQSWELIDGKCIVNEALYDGFGHIIEVLFDNYYNGLDFIPIVIFRNGGLTGETSGKSDVELLWSNQDAYNKLVSDDLDALKFQMFGQTVLQDVSESTLNSITIAPGALIDLQTDALSLNQNRSADIKRLESGFSYGEKFKDTIDRIRSDMFQLMEIPDTATDSLKGYMASGKTMEAIYWDLIDACEEAWTEWGPSLEEMISMIFKLISVYDCYSDRKGRELSEFKTTTDIVRSYSLQKNELEERKADLQDVVAGTMSKKTYIQKWSNVEDAESELKQIISESHSENDYGLDESNE